MLTKYKTNINTLNGVFFISLIAFTATYIAGFEVLKNFSISPLIIGIILGAIYANTLYQNFPEEWNSGIIFSTKTILRIAIVFYGFRLSIDSIIELGFNGILISFFMVSTTFSLGYFVGVKILKLDPEITILTSAGSAICGAAAVLATEGVLKSQAYKSTIAVSTVIVFGTISMFLYPILYKFGILDVNAKEMGIILGSSLHEVAHVVAAGNATEEHIVSDHAIITKMLRVMLLAPFLMIIGLLIAKSLIKTGSDISNTKIVIPWFAVFFVVIVGVNSSYEFPQTIIASIQGIDTFGLTMAMSALGMQTNLTIVKKIGMKPFYLSFILFIWLFISGYFITKIIIDANFIEQSLLSIKRFLLCH